MSRVLRCVSCVKRVNVFGGMSILKLTESEFSFLQYRACSIDSLKSVVDGDCKSLFDDLMYCNGKYEYDYGKKCHSIRRSLLECAVKNKIGELGKNYAM